MCWHEMTIGLFTIHPEPMPGHVVVNDRVCGKYAHLPLEKKIKGHPFAVSFFGGAGVEQGPGEKGRDYFPLGRGFERRANKLCGRPQDSRGSAGTLPDGRFPMRSIKAENQSL